jgi:glycosyltransferase involved in cell wall biosynthesis
MIKKIFMVNRTLGNGGIERNTINMSNRLIEMGYEVHIIVLSNVVLYDVNPKIKLHILGNFLTSYVSIFGRVLNKMIPIYGVSILGNYYKKKFKKELEKIELKYGRAHIILIHGFGAYSCLYKINEQRIFYTSRNTKSELIKNKVPKIFHELAKATLRTMLKDKQIITVSKGIEKDWLSNIKISPKFIETIYNPIDFEFIKNNSIEKLDINYQYILHIGRFVKEKRHDLLLRAFEKINDKDIKLVLLGTGKKDKIEKDIKLLKLENRVIVKGFDKNPYKWMKNAKLLVLSSDHEGLPTVLIESLVCGTTVVSTDCPSGPSEILEGRMSNYLVPVNNIGSLAEKINFALKNKMFESDYIEDLQKFNYTNVIDKYINIIESINNE